MKQTSFRGHKRLALLFEACEKESTQTHAKWVTWKDQLSYLTIYAHNWGRNNIYILCVFHPQAIPPITISPTLQELTFTNLISKFMDHWSNRIGKLLVPPH